MRDEAAVIPSLGRETLRGTWGTVLLPIADGDRIDLAAIAAQLDVLTASGLDGIYSNGTAGEFFTQDEDEFNAVAQLLADACQAAGLACQIGASHPSAQVCRARIQRAARLRPSAIQVILPDWLPLSWPEVLDAVAGFERAADGIPLVLYNPPHAKTRLTPGQLGELGREFPGLIGVKVAGGDAGWCRRARSEVGDLALFVAGHTLATGRANGADGAYSNVACLSPRGAARWGALMAADSAAALTLEGRIQAFLDTHVLPWQREGLGNAALDKGLAHAGRWAPISTRVRWPYTSMPEEAAERLGDIARAELPELFEHLT
jgi:dihydrodipicolinate synthase/N-acetylneuraminate lyase